VSGPQAQWTSTGRLVVGQSGAGELRINDLGRVTAAESRIGEGAQGTVVIQDGQSVNVTSSWNAGNLVVGNGAVGTLTVLNGALVESGTTVLGLANGGDGTVVVAGTANEVSSAWFVREGLTVGQGGKGLVRIQDGASLSSGPLRVSRGSVQIESSGLLLAEKLEVGGADFGFVTAASGSRVIADVVVSGEGASTGSLQLFGGSEAQATRLDHGTLRVQRGNVRLFGGAVARGTRGVVAGPGADVLLQGAGPGGPSRWELDESLVIGGEGGAGTITLANGRVRVPSCRFFLQTGGRLAGVGTLERSSCPPLPSGAPPIEPLVTGEIEPGVQQVASAAAAATAAPANVRRPAPRALTAGELVVAGDLALGPPALVRIPVAGPGQAGLLHVTGKATLGGTLELRFVDGYAPQAGDVLPVLSIDGKTKGAFTAVRVVGLAPGFDFTLGPVNGALAVTALSPGTPAVCADPADGDQDGIADCADACPHAADPPALPGAAQADADGDGIGDACDPCASGVPIEKPVLTVKKGTLAFKGKLRRPDAPPLVPSATGVRLLLEDGAGAVVLDAVAPAGPFDKATKRGWRKLRFKGAKGDPVTSLTLKQSARKLDAIAFKLAAPSAGLALAQLAPPLRATLVLDPPVAETGLCGEMRFAGPRGVNPLCLTDARGKTTCRAVKPGPYVRLRRGRSPEGRPVEARAASVR
jgi:T5SS/PEP-CTERM-associated repeat protein